MATHAVFLAEPIVPPLPSFQLRIFDRVPYGYIAHAETTKATLPLVEPGEVVVVDPRDPDIAEGELFLIEYGRGTHFPSRHIVEPRRYSDAACRLEDDCWMAGNYGRPRSQAELAERLALGIGMGGLSEGPAERVYFNERLIGRVVGIYRPAASETGR